MKAPPEISRDATNEEFAEAMARINGRVKPLRGSRTALDELLVLADRFAKEWAAVEGSDLQLVKAAFTRGARPFECVGKKLIQLDDFIVDVERYADVLRQPSLAFAASLLANNFMNILNAKISGVFGPPDLRDQLLKKLRHSPSRVPFTNEIEEVEFGRSDFVPHVFAGLRYDTVQRREFGIVWCAVM